MGTSLTIDKKTGQKRVVSAYEILLLFFGQNCSFGCYKRYFPALETYTLIIKQVLPKYSDSYILNWHSKFANCLTWPKVDILPYLQIKKKLRGIICPEKFENANFQARKAKHGPSPGVVPTFLISLNATRVHKLNNSRWVLLISV